MELFKDNVYKGNIQTIPELKQTSLTKSKQFLEEICLRRTMA